MSDFAKVEESIRNHPLQLGSVNEIEDVFDVECCHSVKRKYQRCYALTPPEGDETSAQPVPLIELELCSIYPIIHGGAITQQNSLIAPAWVANRLNNQIPYQENGFGGEKAEGTHIPMGDNLTSGLKETFGEEALANGFIIKPFPERITRHPEFRGIQSEFPFLMLLIEELARKGHLSLVGALFIIKQFSLLCPIYGELLAITLFHAVLMGDPDNLLQRIYDIMIRLEHLGSRFRKEKSLYLLTRKYMKCYFGVEIKSKQAVVDFYNGFFTKPVLDISDSDVLLMLSYSNGKVWGAQTGFYEPDPEVAES